MRLQLGNWELIIRRNRWRPKTLTVDDPGLPEAPPIFKLREESPGVWVNGEFFPFPEDGSTLWIPPIALESKNTGDLID